MLDLLKTWAPILIPALSLLAGAGWLQYFLNQRRAKRERYRTILEDFLLPFEGVLKTTSEAFAKLRDDRELINLEYHPGRLQEFFAKLPDDDQRKRLWKSYIEWLQRENQQGLELLARFYGRITLSEFRTASDKYIAHAKEWKIMWEALSGAGALPSSLDSSGTLYAPQFPPELEPALQKELAEVRRRAGQ